MKEQLVMPDMSCDMWYHSHFEINYFLCWVSLVLACIVHKLRQDNTGLIQTRQVVHLMLIMVATFEHLSGAQPTKKYLLFLFTLLKNKAFLIFCFFKFSLICIHFLNVPWKLHHHHIDYIETTSPLHVILKLSKSRLVVLSFLLRSQNGARWGWHFKYSIWVLIAHTECSDLWTLLCTQNSKTIL